MLVDWITLAIGAAVSAAVVWGVYRAAKYLGIKKNSELMEVIKDYIDNAINNYEDLLTDYIESKGEDIAKENKLVSNILKWLNNNCPKILKNYFGTNKDQVEEFVRSYVRGLLNSELKDMLE